MQRIDSILEFCNYLSTNKPINITIQKAIARIAPEYGIGRIDVDISEKKGFLPNAATKYLTLYQNINLFEYAEVIQYRFSVEKEGETCVSIFPVKGKTYSDEEKIYLDLFVDISFFYFGRIILGNLVEKSAMTHFLSGLPNAGGYMKKVTPLAEREGLLDYNAFFFNLKGFGIYGKNYGIKQADDMIRQYGQKISTFAARNEVIGHLGGDNFVAVIRKEHSKAFIDFLSKVTVTAEKDGEIHNVDISATIGVWEIVKPGYSLGEIISLPSIAMNTAKNVLHKPICYVSDELLKQVTEQKNVLKNFPAALKNEEFMVYYQPKVDSRTNLLEGAEALVRWRHEGRMISPGAFVPVLEREGLIKELDLYMLEHTCADIRNWIDSGITPVQVSSNISRNDLRDEKLADKIADIINRYNVDHKWIQIEVTESVNDAEHELLAEFLRKLWSMNISTAIDDFGSGYSSLSTLRNFQINMLKIDRSFINNETFSKNDEIILSDIIHMAKRLGIEVITEGVERKDQLDFVNKVGCFLIQGFYYDKPMPEPDFRAKLLHKTYAPVEQA